MGPHVEGIFGDDDALLLWAITALILGAFIEHSEWNARRE